MCIPYVIHHILVHNQYYILQSISSIYPFHILLHLHSTTSHPLPQSHESFYIYCSIHCLVQTMNWFSVPLEIGDHEVSVVKKLPWSSTLLKWSKNLPQQLHIFPDEMCFNFLMLIYFRNSGRKSRRHWEELSFRFNRKEKKFRRVHEVYWLRYETMDIRQR